MTAPRSEIGGSDAGRLEAGPRAAGPRVQRLAPQGFGIGDEIYRAALLTPERAHAWTPPALADLAIADFAPVLALDPPPEFLILGTGARQAFAPRALADAFGARGIGIEAMDSRAAARTWGVLRGEGRWIAAALLPL
jgi:uncharacterized protein